MTIFEYMQNNPFMTFLFALLTIVAVRHLFGFVTIMLRGYPPEHVDVEGRERD